MVKLAAMVPMANSLMIDDQSQGDDFVELSGGCGVFCDSLELAAGPDKKKAHKRIPSGKLGRMLQLNKLS